MKLKVFIILIATLAASADLPKGFLNSHQQFSAKLHQKVAEDKQQKNFVICPINVQILIAALSAADRHGTTRTAKQIEQVLRCHNEECIRAVAEKTNQSHDDFKIFNAMKLFMDRNNPIQDWYDKALRSISGVQTDKVDSYNPNAIEGINQWVSDKTNQAISNSIDGNFCAVAVVVDTLYLLGKWSVAFDQLRNERVSFYGTRGTIDTEMMVRKNTPFHYYENDRAQYLRLDLQNKDSHVVFILPRTSSTFNKLVEDDLKLDNYSLVELTVKLPKFSFKSNVIMTPILKKLGLGNIFEKSSDLKGFIKNQRQVSIVNIYQTTTIEMVESGIRATSAVSTQGKRGNNSTHNPILNSPQTATAKTFIANRPFLFYATVDNLVTFCGSVVEP